MKGPEGRKIMLTEEKIKQLAAASGKSVEEISMSVDMITGSATMVNPNKVKTEKNRSQKRHTEKTHQRDKRKNTVEFNVKAKKRREKAKHDAKARKKNQRRKK